MTEEEYQEISELATSIKDKLAVAYEAGDPAGNQAQEVAELHRKWLSFYWDSYSKEAHATLAQMYVDDPRFTAYYDEERPRHCCVPPGRHLDLYELGFHKGIDWNSCFLFYKITRVRPTDFPCKICWKLSSKSSKGTLRTVLSSSGRSQSLLSSFQMVRRSSLGH